MDNEKKMTDTEKADFNASLEMINRINSVKHTELDTAVDIDNESNLDIADSSPDHFGETGSPNEVLKYDLASTKGLAEGINF